MRNKNVPSNSFQLEPLPQNLNLWLEGKTDLDSQNLTTLFAENQNRFPEIKQKILGQLTNILQPLQNEQAEEANKKYQKITETRQLQTNQAIARLIQQIPTEIQQEILDLTATPNNNEGNNKDNDLDLLFAIKRIIETCKSMGELLSIISATNILESLDPQKLINKLRAEKQKIENILNKLLKKSPQAIDKTS